MQHMKTCAITGHRPSRFKFKYKENNTGCKRLKKRLRDQFVLIYGQGIRRFYVGGTLGVGIWAGEILLRLKEQPEYCDIELVIALPFEGHSSNWDERSQKRLEFLIRHSIETVIVGISDAPPAVNYRRCTEYLIDHSDILLAVYDNDRTVRSNTGLAVNYAEKRGIPMIFLHPHNGTVSVFPSPST